MERGPSGHVSGESRKIEAAAQRHRNEKDSSRSSDNKTQYPVFSVNPERSLNDLAARQHPAQQVMHEKEVRRAHRVAEPQHSTHEKALKQPNKSVRQTPGKSQPQHHALNHTKPHSVQKTTM
uniref:Uncharacterized protein n=1 Tax=Tetraselmis sp. GSL018 TaxID=582737 RepID=A0A061RJU1_9CHLO|eukprot:CAMPEP_0177578128 /NCGR_PEP_ID=MMETSP0419_2-20121207/167_1 /TAXON_ID=582737 /ORGANISM="Tetraselmis sp., Strain GSL018" /LENGTH=121 /DNA_ID=CAMNT_0019066519 /DNA_START=132 /DNA_END=497 /DNA_ORIENTATION=+